MPNKLVETEVNISNLDNFTVTVHLKGTGIWKVRLWLALQLIKLVNLLAPSNVNFSLCNECLNYNGETDV